VLHKKQQSQVWAMDKTGEDGYELWLRYRRVDNQGQLAQYRKTIHSATVLGKSATADLIRRELARALPALLDRAVPLSEQTLTDHALVVGTAAELDAPSRRPATIGL
jgi:alpha-glucuronidase